MLSTLSDTQKAVVDTITMRLNLAHALDYVKHMGFPMGRRTYYRHKKKIQDMKLERLHFIAKVAYEDQHLERVDRMDLIENQMWINYCKEQDRFKRVKILVEITNNQPYISSYYEATKNLVEGQNFKLKQIPLKPPKGMNKTVMDEDGELYWDKPDVE
jgi:hypothetical protein